MTATMKWSDLNIAQGVYDWSNFDTWMSTSQANGQDVLFTVYNTPAWASSNPTALCAATVGGCYPPLDLNADGTGTNQHFKDFVTALIKHAGAGKIKYLEIWNEPNITTEWTGTYAQLVRMAKDASTVAKGIDPNILISGPPETGDGKNSLYMNWLGNFLAAGGGQYVDTIDFHGYAYQTAEDLAVRIGPPVSVTSREPDQSLLLFWLGLWQYWRPLQYKYRETHVGRRRLPADLSVDIRRNAHCALQRCWNGMDVQLHPAERIPGHGSVELFSNVHKHSVHHAGIYGADRLSTVPRYQRHPQDGYRQSDPGWAKTHPAGEQERMVS